MIDITHLSKRYETNDTDTLHDISLSLPNNGLVFLLGKSGAGKSTFLNIIGAMDQDYQGSVKFNQVELKSMNESMQADYRLHNIAFVFQSFCADEEETVENNLLKALDILSLRQEEKMVRIEKRLEQVGLLDKKKQKFKYLSGGEKKRISLVKALIKESDILLADEPLASLNQTMRKQITSLLVEESKKRLVLVITHERDDLPSDCFVYQLNQGKITLLKKGMISSDEKKRCPERKKFSGFPLFRQLLTTLKNRRELLILTFFSLMIGLFAITFSFQLSSGVKTSMSQALSDYMDENSMVVSLQDQGYLSSGYESVTYSQLMHQEQIHSQYIKAITPFYLDSMDTIFQNNQKITIQYQKKSIHLKQLSLDSFLNYSLPFESDETISYYPLEIEDDEVILSLTEEMIFSLYFMMFQSKPNEINEEVLETLTSEVIEENVYLQIKANNAQWGYQQDYALKIKGLALSKNCYIIHPSETFAPHFVKDIMHFKEIPEEEEINPDTPWTLHYTLGFRLKQDTVAEFISAFFHSSESNGYTLRMIKNTTQYSVSILSTHNHVSMVKDYLPKIDLSEIESFLESEGSNIQSVSYSSPVYTYTASGYISGFEKPFFFSKYKEKLNLIEDNSYSSDEDLGSFQGSLIDDIDGVIKADLISSMDNQSGLTFVSTDHHAISPLYGKAPSNYQEIGISKKMALTLFSSVTNALGKELYTLRLDETTKEGDHYINHFSQGSLIVSGIYDEDKNALYQDSLFPLAYTFYHSGLDSDSMRIESAVIKVDLSSHDVDYYQKSIKKFGSYQCSFPMLSMIQEIETTLDRLALIFFSLAILSLCSASFLLILSLYLIMEKDKKEIAILLSLGYRKKEIGHFYLSFSLLLGLLSYLFSLGISFFAETKLRETLLDTVNLYQINLAPFFISFLICIVLSIGAGLSVKYYINRISVKEAFLASSR